MKNPWIKYGLIGIGLIFGCGLSAAFGGLFSRHIGESSYTLSFVDFVALMLTAVSVLITLLAIFIALLAFIGWSTFLSSAQRSAERHLDKEMQTDGALANMLEKRIAELAYRGITPDEADEAEEE